jgi:hypothetical protein
VERFDLKKLSKVEVRKEYQIEISNVVRDLNNKNDKRTEVGRGKSFKKRQCLS